MLTSAPAVEELVEALEVRFLANRDEQLHFGLLTDFTCEKVGFGHSWFFSVANSE